MGSAHRPTSTITVYSDGCRLCTDAVAIVSRVAKGSPDAVVERRIADLDATALAQLGLRATPAIALDGQGVVSVGCPTEDEAALLVRRAEIDARILAHAIPTSEAIQRFAKGNTKSEATAKALASEFYPFCNEFPLFLAAAISHVHDEKSRLLLVSNLYEEHGNLDLERLHPALFRKFVKGLGLESAKLEQYDRGTPGAQASQWVTSICREGPAHRALATLYAVELLFAPCCDIIIKGLKHLHLAPESVYFWELHSGKDVEHAEQLRAGLLKACPTPEAWRESVELASDVSLMFYELFDFIARANTVTTGQELEVFQTVKRLCHDSSAAKKHPVEYKDAAYYFGINIGKPEHWFLRAFCDTDRHSIVTRFPLERAKLLSPGFDVERAPDVFGQSRVYFQAPKDLERLRALVVAAYEQEVQRAETGADAEEAHW